MAQSHAFTWYTKEGRFLIAYEDSSWTEEQTHDLGIKWRSWRQGFKSGTPKFQGNFHQLPHSNCN